MMSAKMDLIFLKYLRIELKLILPSDVGHQATVLIGSCGWSRSDAKAEQNLQKAMALKDIHAIEVAPRWSRGELKKSMKV